MTATMARPELKETFTSTGSKFFAHQEAMQNLRNGKGQPIVTHLMPTDRCQHTCAFCSVQTRAGNVLKFNDMLSYVDTLRGYGLKAVILSGGGNPLLYVCPETKKGIADLILALADRGLDIGMITNGMKLRDWGGRSSYATLPLQALDALSWVRISMAGLDHEENEVYVPAVDPAKTTLGFSYVYHDIYQEPAEKNHGKVSTRRDLISLDNLATRMWKGSDRIHELVGQIGDYAERYHPKYVRLLPNCLEPDLIPGRCEELRKAADQVNRYIGRDCAFVQFKPPAAPQNCYLGYPHPVLNSDGYVYPCDSVVLNTEVRKPGEHDFGSAWRICHWADVADMYDKPVRSLIDDPAKMCPGCVFTQSQAILQSVVDGVGPIPRTDGAVEHANFV